MNTLHTNQYKSSIQGRYGAQTIWEEYFVPHGTNKLIMHTTSLLITSFPPCLTPKVISSQPDSMILCAWQKGNATSISILDANPAKWWVHLYHVAQNTFPWLAVKHSTPVYPHYFRTKKIQKFTNILYKC